MAARLAGILLRHRLLSVAIAALCGLGIGFGALRAASTPGSPRVASPVATANAPARVADGQGISQAPPVATATPAPTSTPGTIDGIGARLPTYPRLAADVTLGAAAPTVQPRPGSGLVYSPDPRYAAEDTLTDTGPGPPGPLTGLPTKPQYANRRPVAVVIDNFDPDARPQAGLNRASVVFDALAEGGITRYMAIYLEKDAPIVGPVRSARIYFDAWAAGLHAIYAHAGGNNDALAEIPSLHGIANVDGLALGAANPLPWDIYWRSNDRVAPHNFYTDTARVRAFADATGRTTGTVPIPSLPHKAPAALWTRPRGGWIDVDFSGPSYNVRYRYDPRCDCYPRATNGVAQVDEISLRQIAPSNVVVLFAGVLPDPASDTPGSIDVQTVGLGRALYFRDGGLVRGSWRKDAIGAPLQLLDTQGQPVAFNPGQTWFEVVPIGNEVTWQLHS